ncbi:nucleotidyltransferase family protein [Candidatus Uhrbacteria bacterium]|nr:nucleotidyltransferase family protein [Candidatus Uhrbacteria bacterium]
MSEKIKRIKEAIIPILRKEGVLRSAVYGSFARGEETEDSDLDLLVELKKGKSLLDLVDLEYKLTDALGRDVDVVTFASVHPRLKKRIEEDQIPLL